MTDHSKWSTIRGLLQNRATELGETKPLVEPTTEQLVEFIANLNDADTDCVLYIGFMIQQETAQLLSGFMSMNLDEGAEDERDLENTPVSTTVN